LCLVIRRNAAEISKLFDSIGTAQMEQEIQKRVLQIAEGQRSRLEEQTGIQPAYDEGELKSYLAEVLEEIAESKKVSKNEY
jgi:hypothetical protein